MSHLHVPDGVLPPWLWLSGLGLALVLLAWATRLASPREVAYRGALGGVMLAAMAVPFGPIEYHLTLAGPLGVLLGPGGAFQVAFIASAILALMGHGGLTVIGLNALVLGACSAVAAGVYRLLIRSLPAPGAMAFATGAGQAVAGGLWLLVIAVALRYGSPGVVPHAHAAGRVSLIAGIATPLWILAVLAESLVAFGIGRFLVRVHPALLGRVARAPAALETA